MRNRLLRSFGLGVVLGVVATVLLSAWSGPGRRALFLGAAPGGNPAVRVAAIRAGASDAFLLQALRDEDADVRLIAAQHLGGTGGAIPARIAALVEALGDPHAGVRREAAESLYRIGTTAAPALSV